MRTDPIDVILAWLLAEDDGAKRKIVSLLADRDEDLSLITNLHPGPQGVRQSSSSLHHLRQEATPE
jgi:hypothetical protein